MDPIKWIRQALRRKKEDDSSERKKLIANALLLERSFLTKQISEPEYRRDHRQISAKLAVLDLYKSVHETLEGINSLSKEKADLLAHDFSDKAKEILRESYALEEKSLAQRNDYNTNKLSVGEYVTFLKDVNSKALDMDHALRIITRRLENVRVREISEELRRDLGVRGSSRKEKEKMFEDVLLEARSKHRNTGYIQRYKPQKKSE